MKKILFISTLLVCMASGFTSTTFAAVTDTNQTVTPNSQTDTNTPQGSTGATLTNPLKVASLGELVKSGVQVFSYIAVLIAALMFVVVGFKYIMAQGKPDEMKKASQWLLAIVIGVAIVIGANIAITIVINTLSATGVVDPKVIQSARDAIR